MCVGGVWQPYESIITPWTHVQPITVIHMRISKPTAPPMKTLKSDERTIIGRPEAQGRVPLGSAGGVVSQVVMFLSHANRLTPSTHQQTRSS